MNKSKERDMIVIDESVRNLANFEYTMLKKDGSLIDFHPESNDFTIKMTQKSGSTSISIIRDNATEYICDDEGETINILDGSGKRIDDLSLAASISVNFPYRLKITNHDHSEHYTQGSKEFQIPDQAESITVYNHHLALIESIIIDHNPITNDESYVGPTYANRLLQPTPAWFHNAIRNLSSKNPVMARKIILQTIDDHVPYKLIHYLQEWK